MAWEPTSRPDWVKKGDRCVADDGRVGLVRARVHNTSGENVQAVVQWDDGTGGLIAIDRLREESAEEKRRRKIDEEGS